MPKEYTKAYMHVYSPSSLSCYKVATYIHKISSRSKIIVLVIIIFIMYTALLGCIASYSCMIYSCTNSVYKPHAQLPQHNKLAYITI